MLKLFAFTLLVASAQANFWSSCNLANVLTPDYIRSDACVPGAQRCIATRGQTITADAYFTPVFVHQRLDATATAHHILLLGGSLNIPMTPPHDNACNDLYNAGTGQFVGCPTTPNMRKLWTIFFTVPTIIPALNNVRVRFMLSEGGVNHGCVDVMADIIG